MTARKDIDGFLALRRLALAGASRSGRGFGFQVLRDLLAKGYEVHPVHPEATELAGRRCVRSLAELPEGVEGLVLVVPPVQTERLVREAAERGIRRVWMQQGAESAEAVDFCERNGISAVHGECIMMFAEPTGWLHRAHRGLLGVFGRLPE